MKEHFNLKMVVISILLLSILNGIFGCTIIDYQPSLYLLDSELNLTVNDTYDLQEIVDNTSSPDLVIKYEVEDQKIALCDGSVLTALESGNTRIKISYENYSIAVYLNLTVKETIESSVVIDSEKNIIIVISEVITLNTTLSNISDDVVWESSNENIATVFEGIVTGVSVGQTTIKASAGEYFDTIEVEVIPKCYNVTFMDGEVVLKTEKVDEGSSATAPTNIEKDGYIFSKWDREYTNITEDIIINAIYKKISQITYSLDGGELESDAITSYVESEDTTLPIPTKVDYSFEGWLFENNMINAINPLITGDITLIAIWTYNGSTDEDTLEMISEELLLQFDEKIVEADISLPLSLNKVDITWNSRNNDVISNEGEFNRPYQETIVIFDVLLSLNNSEKTLEIVFNAEGYKDLNEAIASSYIYRNYSTVTDSYFETLDIINCAFITANGAGTLSGTSFLNNCKNYIIPKAHANGCYVIASVAPESSWSTFAASASTIETFATNVVKLINDYGFDGVDIDWEYPKSGQYTWFTNLVKEVREKVKANNANHLVTAAIAGGKWQPAYYDLLNSCQYLDYINMMTYGMVSNTGYYQNALYPHSSYDNTTYNCGKTLSSCSISESVAIYRDTYKIPLNKIIVGLAFYGIKQTRTSTTSSWGSGKSTLYNTMRTSNLNNSNYLYFYDEVSQVPYLVKSDGLEFISYDNEKSIKAKCNYVIEQGLAGVMHWESGCDTSGTLLNAVREGLNK